MLQNLERQNVNLGKRKKNFEKAHGNAERQEETKECGHASREGPAGMRAQLWLFGGFEPAAFSLEIYKIVKIPKKIPVF